MTLHNISPRWAIIAVVLALAIGAAGSWLLRPGAPPPSMAAVRPPGPAAEEEAARLKLPAGAGGKNPIETVPVQRLRLARDVELVGSVGYDANHYALVGPLIAGRIVALHVGVGTKVRAGQVLAELESAEVGTAQAAFLTARAANQAAQANLRRETELAERRVSSERDRELAEAQAQTEAANLSAAVQRLRALGLQNPALPGRAGRVPLLSPLDGTVLTRQVTLGQAVQPASDAFTVSNLAHLWVLLDIFEKDLPYVHVHQHVDLRTEVYPGRHFPARVAYVGQVIDEKTRTAPVRVEFDNPEGLFRPGQFVTATLQGDGKSSAVEVLAAPRRAVLTVEGKPLCFVQEADGSFSRRVVELGVSGGGMVELRSGVSAGDRVAADGAFLLKSELLR